MMKKDLRIAGLVIGTLVLLGLMAHAYKAVRANQAGQAAEKLEFIAVRGRTTAADVPLTRTANLPLMELPKNQLDLLTGSGGLDSGSYFSCWITNASSWTVSELRFRIKAVETHGMERWERRYRESIHIPPNRKAFVRFKVSEGGSGAETEWEIVAGRGHPPD